jgi:hypothetical protein
MAGPTTSASAAGYASAMSPRRWTSRVVRAIQRIGLIRSVTSRDGVAASKSVRLVTCDRR